ncbi:MAG: WecB/TagA/CpsF family glycosyltransferase [Anaerolineales bacterium]|nr:WecB/TagA/CpsF family glycosyltransferase [Anaerolineales bacterium]
MACVDDARARRAVNGAGLVTPDGMPVVWLLKLAGFDRATRVYGPDVMDACCKRGEMLGWRHYFYGGAEGVPERVAAIMGDRYPHLEVVGTYSPPFRALTASEDADVVVQINAARPHVVWVGLGSPKQDLWMAQHRDLLGAEVLVGVGAAFDFAAGTVKQAPRWLSRVGLEWAFRLVQEPRRLWRRYLIGNPRFVWNLALQKLGLRQFPTEDSQRHE